MFVIPAVALVLRIIDRLDFKIVGHWPPPASEVRRTCAFRANEMYFLASKVPAKEQDAQGFIKDIVELLPESAP